MKKIRLEKVACLTPKKLQLRISLFRDINVNAKSLYENYWEIVLFYNCDFSTI